MRAFSLFGADRGRHLGSPCSIGIHDGEAGHERTLFQVPRVQRRFFRTHQSDVQNRLPQPQKTSPRTCGRERSNGTVPVSLALKPIGRNTRPSNGEAPSRV